MIIRSKRVWLNGQFIPAQIEWRQGKIVRVSSYNKEACDRDYGLLRIIPGMIDLHTHGAYGFDTNDAEEEGLKNWARRIPEDGCTAFLATTVTQMSGVLEKAVANVAQVMEQNPAGAEILGIHLEGPFIDRKYRGAQPPEAIALPSVTQFEKYQEAAKGRIRYVTLAPEHDDQHALIRYLAEHRVVASLGHSGADFQEAKRAFEDGAKTMTHIFNGMSGVHHRTPGLGACALALPQVYGEIICDGLHVVPEMLHLFFASKDRNHGVMVTDSLRFKHFDEQLYRKHLFESGKTKEEVEKICTAKFSLGGHAVEVRRRREEGHQDQALAYLAGTDTIAGSILSMNQGLRILIEEAKVPVEKAIAAATCNPARCLGVEDRKGFIRRGMDADLVVLKEDYEVEETFCRGRACLHP